MKQPLKEHITLSVPGKKTNTPIYIGNGIFDKIKSIIPFNMYSGALIILDENVSHHWSERIQKVIGKDVSCLTIPSGEKNKTLSVPEKIWTILAKKGFDRKSLIINIGGGMVCDLGAFAASTYMRGIDFIQVPTTLLAQADAAIGGKTGFNFNGLKNTIGTFAAPVAVISDTSFLSSLPKKELNSGFAEIIKHALVADRDLFDFLLKKKFNSINGKEIDKILSISTSIKCAIVRNDPYEKKERKKLNFGHTVGHAVEMACQDLSKPLLHGEAVAIGMIAEARMSFLSGCLSEKKFRDIERLLHNAGLPNKTDAAYKKIIANKMLSDKKNAGKQIRWVFLEDIGKVKVDVTLPDEIVNESLNYILK
jgi:3-dehydroquinate synthase